MPTMQQPEAYLSRITADIFDEFGRLRDCAVKDVVLNIANAFVGWVDLIEHGKRKNAKNAAHAQRA